MTAQIDPAPTPKGLLLAACVIGGWAAVHIYSVFFHALSAPIWITLALIAVQCWLYAGMFIVAHDTMHGSLVPNKPKSNAVIGKAIMFVYAGFDWEYMRKAHHAHHRSPGTQQDPDFNADNPNAFWPWYYKFFTQYFGIKQIIILVCFTLTYVNKKFLLLIKMSLKRIETRLLFINSWVVMCCLFSNTVLLQEIFLVKNDMELLN